MSFHSCLHLAPPGFILPCQWEPHPSHASPLPVPACLLQPLNRQSAANAARIAGLEAEVKALREDNFAGWLAGWVAGWMAGWPAGWLGGWVGAWVLHVIT